MGKLSNMGKAIIVGGIAILAVVVIILIIIYGNSGGTIAGDNGNATSSSSDAALTAASPAQTATSTKATTPTTATTKKTTTAETQSSAAPVIHIITPVKNDVWTIGVQNPISWDKPGNFSGALSLIDATTGDFVGTILPEVGANQTSYTWNTLSVSLSRSNPSGKDITPGTYQIELTYDGNNIKPIFSSAFTITN